MSKIEKYSEHLHYYAYVTYFKDEGMYKVKASLHVNIEEPTPSSRERGYDTWHDVTDVDLEFFVAGKKCTYVGFKEIYEKLFTTNSWERYERDLYEEFEAHYMKNKVKIK